MQSVSFLRRYTKNDMKNKLLIAVVVISVMITLLGGLVTYQTIKTTADVLAEEKQATEQLVESFYYDFNEEDVIYYINQERLKVGAGPVVQHELLVKSASLKAIDMTTKYYWAHTSPEGIEPWYFFEEAGYNYRLAGENLAREFTDSKSIVDAWLNSPIHKEIMLDKRYKDVGIGFSFNIQNGLPVLIVVSHFGTR
jgi:uncharacterized protein YkwD